MQRGVVILDSSHMIIALTSLCLAPWLQGSGFAGPLLVPTDDVLAVRLKHGVRHKWDKRKGCAEKVLPGGDKRLFLIYLKHG